MKHELKTNESKGGTATRRAARLRQLSVAASLAILSGLGWPAGVRAAGTEALVGGNTAFALDLYARLSGAPGNLFFSPYSISTCLGMTYAGARGDTATQMAQVLRFNQDDARLHSSFGALQRQLNSAANQSGIQLDLANALWTQQGHRFLPAFLKIASDDYQANVNQADFRTGADAAAREINRWVARKTKDKIQDILAPGSVDELTRLVLANAIYFKGAWACRFEEAATSTQPFHISTTRQADAPLMSHFDTVKYMGNDDFQAVALPYKGDELSMVILLPRQIDALGRLEQQLNPAFLDGALGRMEKRKVQVFLPRFKMESSFNLNETLAKMGMPDAFDDKADFSGCNGRKGDLSISAVLHKAWVKVNEEGTEAAAATVVVVRSLALVAEPPPPVFRADHPFFFMIRDTRSGSLLFIGRLADPPAASGS